jgi:1,4-alpha-glucan branching enzyme
LCGISILKANAFLKKIRVGADCENVSVIGDFNNWSLDAAYATKRIEEELYEVIIEYDKPQMEYQFAFGDFRKRYFVRTRKKI